jgi:hypothetical protein
MYPNLSIQSPAFDQYGNALEVSPIANRSTAGSLTPGQSLFTATIRENAGNASTLTFPLFTVPANGCFYISDLQATGAAIANNAELVISVLAGSLTIAHASLGPTSPISSAFETQPMVPPGTVVSVSVANTAATTPAFNVFMGGFYQQFGY